MQLAMIGVGMMAPAAAVDETLRELAPLLDEGVPAPVLTAALYARFSSRGASDFADRIRSAMRHAFGGHLEKP
jgi:6-phosphogluconate dehydrogenase (decarboxylating)